MARYLRGNDGVRNFLYRNATVPLTTLPGRGFDTNGKALAGMGTEIVDLDGDGLPDIFFTLSDQYSDLPQPRKLLFEDERSKPDCHPA
jgi:hypothetical protein